jgi:perosamine synthetase
MNRFIPISKPSITSLERTYVNDAVESTWISSLGKYIDQFEEEFATFCDCKYAVSCSNGTVAIHLALVALGIGSDDEVIVPNLSFIATANTVLHAGATPIFVDIDPFNLCMAPLSIEAAITPKTKAIMPVHLYGHPADMRAINKIAKKHNLLVIEDAAEAHGATIEGQKVGSWGKCATFSFYGNKVITTGEGGMVTTNDKELYTKMRYLRDHAMSKEKRYWHTELGYNYRMTNIQAALGCAQLQRIDDLLVKRKHIFKEYEKQLKGLEGISLNRTYDWAENVYWLIYLEIENMNEKGRDELMIKLKELGVDSRPYFYPMSMMPYCYTEVDTPETFRKYEQGINLPTFHDISDEEVEYICLQVKKVI